MSLGRQNRFQSILDLQNNPCFAPKKINPCLGAKKDCCKEMQFTCGEALDEVPGKTWTSWTRANDVWKQLKLRWIIEYFGLFWAKKVDRRFEDTQSNYTVDWFLILFFGRVAAVKYHLWNCLDESCGVPWTPHSRCFCSGHQLKKTCLFSYKQTYFIETFSLFL